MNTNRRQLAKLRHLRKLKRRGRLILRNCSFYDYSASNRFTMDSLNNPKAVIFDATGTFYGLKDDQRITEEWPDLIE